MHQRSKVHEVVYHFKTVIIYCYMLMILSLTSNRALRRVLASVLAYETLYVTRHVNEDFLMYEAVNDEI